MSATTGLSSLSLQLTRARFASREGESLLYLASTFAYVVGSALALTVAGGTWMFYNRWQHPTGLLAEVVGLDSTYDAVLMFYFTLALIACALLVPTMVGLAASAAVLGARGRERRLAALRLLGLSSGDVTRMSLIDTLIQAGLGTLVGLVGYWLTLPLWSNLTMQAVPVAPAEMSLPWWLLIAVCLAIVAIGLVASWWGLRQVRISPLGVARRTNAPKLGVWRLLAFVALAGVAYLLTLSLNLGASLLPFLIFAGVIVLVIVGINLLGPWLLQVFSLLLARLPWASVMWASRRVQSNPRQTWQRVAGIGLLTLIGGYIAMMPLVLNTDQDDETLRTFASQSAMDFTSGALITLAVGMALTATSILITQASAVLERADQTRALSKMGAGTSFLTGVSWLETLGPLVVSAGLGTAAGIALASPMRAMADAKGATGDTSGIVILGVVLAAGLVLTALALAASWPLQRQVLAVQERRGD